MREALTVRIDGLLLHGTSHAGPVRKDVGILFLNSGSLPRSSRGDLYAHLADDLAEEGFPCFRFDLPGLGDSQGDVPDEYAEFYELVQEGEFAGTVVSLAKDIRTAYGLAGLVLAGICGGAQTSVFAASKERGAGVAGLVLLDMPFFLYRRSPAAAAQAQDRSLLGRVRSGIAGGKARLRDWVLARKWEPQATKVYYGLKKITTRTNGNALPPDTNLPLLKALSGLLGDGLPALLVTAHPPIPEPQSFDYIGHVAARTGGRLERARIQGTTHSFVENGGAEAVRAAVSAWLAKLPRSARG
ncbi:MAG TPA: alpha/beta fold hydrolase [Candidatus Bathyarchaeia archaeon]|nr:alpha/beta fold hydrolase [Candidatus Bathyarchaeia archaeon]